MKKKKQNKIRIPVPKKPSKVEDSPKIYKRKKAKRIAKQKIEQEMMND